MVANIYTTRRRRFAERLPSIRLWFCVFLVRYLFCGRLTLLLCVKPQMRVMKFQDVLSLKYTGLLYVRIDYPLLSEHYCCRAGSPSVLSHLFHNSRVSVVLKGAPSTPAEDEGVYFQLVAANHTSINSFINSSSVPTVRRGSVRHHQIQAPSRCM